MLNNLNETNGFKLSAEGSDDWNGIAVSHVDDFNNDGYNDLLIGAVEASPNGVAMQAVVMWCLVELR